MWAGLVCWSRCSSVNITGHLFVAGSRHAREELWLSPRLHWSVWTFPKEQLRQKIQGSRGYPVGILLMEDNWSVQQLQSIKATFLKCENKWLFFFFFPQVGLWFTGNEDLNSTKDCTEPLPFDRLGCLIKVTLKTTILKRPLTILTQEFSFWIFLGLFFHNCCNVLVAFEVRWYFIIWLPWIKTSKLEIMWKVGTGIYEFSFSILNHSLLRKT